MTPGRVSGRRRGPRRATRSSSEEGTPERPPLQEAPRSREPVHAGAGAGAGGRQLEPEPEQQPEPQSPLRSAAGGEARAWESPEGECWVVALPAYQMHCEPPTCPQPLCALR